MVQSFYTLLEAAKVLGMSEDELKRMAQSREIRAFADGGSWKFRQQDIEELARTRQHGSDPELQLSESASDSDSGSVDILDEDAQVVLDGIQSEGFDEDEDSAKTIIGSKSGAESDVRLVLSDDETGDSDVRLVGDSAASLGGAKSEDESDESIELGSDIAKAPSDSDIRMTFEDSAVNAKSEDQEEESADRGERTEEITLREEDFELPSGSEKGSDSMKASTSSAGEPAAQSASDDDLDFNFDDDMSTGFKVEGGSDFDLAGFDSETDLATGSGASGSADDDDLTIPLDSIKMQEDDEIGLAPDDSDITAGAPDSGINLNKPDDSGISLESSDQESSDSEFELSLDSDSETDLFGSDEIPAFKDDDDDDAPVAAKSKSKSPSSSDTEEVSDSDFELAIDEDFEDDEESGSEVVAIDEDEEEEDVVAADEDYDEEYDDYDDAAAATGQQVALQRGGAGVVASNPPWPGWLAAPLSITAIMLIICGMMMFEVMRNAWSHQTPYTLSGTIIQIFYDLAKSVGIAN